MIPHRVTIEGFLSYRQKVEFYFDGAPIWMLTGENGAGKSSVFDAISFALYGVHRGGKSDVEELINRRSDRLAVEFDFLLGDDCYRVHRTVPRKGGATYQATHLNGPNPPNRQRTSPQPVPNTDTKAGLNGWVQRQLGLNDEAFKMSVLLEQGKSDALLSAKPLERHKLLSQLVNLSRYEALEARAKARQANLRETLGRYRSQMAELPLVSESDLLTQKTHVDEAKLQVNQAAARLLEVREWMVHAKNWQELQHQQQTIMDSLARMRQLIVDAPQIENAFARKNDLEKHLPHLQSLLALQQKEARHSAEATQRNADAASYAAKESEALPRLQHAHSALTSLQQTRDKAQNARNEALQRTNELIVPLNDLNTIDHLRQEIRCVDAQLSVFAPDLDEQLTEAQKDVETRSHLRLLQPYLQSYAKARATWQQATAQLAEARRQEASSLARISEVSLQVERERLAVQEARLTLGSAQSEAAVTKNTWRATHEQVKKLEEVDSLPACPYCGQALSSEHLTTERNRLQEALTATTKAANDAVAVEKAAQEVLYKAEKLLEECKNNYHYTKSKRLEQQAFCQKLVDEQTRCEMDGMQALVTLRANHAPDSFLPHADSISDAFALTLPSTDSLAQLHQEVNGLTAAQEKLKELRARCSQRDQYRTSRDHFARQLQPLALRYSPECAQSIRAEALAATAARDQAHATYEALMPQLNEAAERQQHLEQELNALRKGRQEAEGDERIERRLADEAALQAQQEWAKLSPAWQEATQPLDSQHITVWQAELVTLAGSAYRHESLREAYSQLAFVETRSTEIERDLEAIPLAARQPFAHLQAEETAIRIRQSASENHYQEARTRYQSLQDQRRRREELAQVVRATEKNEQHCTLLVKYLGRDYLQRYLLQQAERTIVTLANEILDHASGGTLSMELRPNDGDSGMQKAFDIIVENRATQTPQERMLPAWLLSGSQRFRVAISMALAIGQYASKNSQRIESVIIDEGFGSLDRQGLRDMESALRDLSGLLGRIILVSHQDDFARAFPHRYNVWLEDGASQAGLVDELELA